MAIDLPPETRDRLIVSIKRYFEDVMEIELPGSSAAAGPKAEGPGIGDLKAMLLLDFVLAEIGPVIYNQAVSDAQATMSEMVDELDGTCFEPESGYWEKRSQGRAG